MLILDKDTVDHIPRKWQYFRKTTLTRMARMHQPFAVKTREGIVTCEDGWLAIDSAGWPYPIDAAEQAAVYVNNISFEENESDAV